MKKVGNSLLNPVLILRIGIGGVLVYAGVSTIVNPILWIGFVPKWMTIFVSAETFLVFHGAFSLLLGLVVLSGFMTPLSSAIAFLNFLLIMIFFGVDEVTFRDFGLLAGALALFLLTYKPNLLLEAQS